MFYATFRWYCRFPDMTGVAIKSVGGNFYLKINQKRGDLFSKTFQIGTSRREKHPKIIGFPSDLF